MLVSGSAQAPAAGVAGPAQPTEVGLRARVSFDLPSSPSPVDPALGKGLKEDGDSVVSIPQLRTGLSLTLPLSFVPIIESHLPSPLLAPFCRFGASLPGLLLEGNLVRVSISPPRLLWSIKLWGRGGGLRCVWVTLQGPCTLTIFTVGWV